MSPSSFHKDEQDRSELSVW